MGQWIETLDRLVWGPGLLAALLLTGGMLTVRLHFLPWRRLPWALGQALRPGRAAGPGLSPFQALMTTLAGLVVVLMILLREISALFDLAKALFDF